MGPDLENKGLISENRNNKATLSLTIPRSVFKSSTRDLITSMFRIMILVSSEPQA